jgi:hypothetical protein
MRLLHFFHIHSASGAFACRIVGFLALAFHRALVFVFSSCVGAGACKKRKHNGAGEEEGFHGLGDLSVKGTANASNKKNLDHFREKGKTQAIP